MKLNKHIKEIIMKEKTIEEAQLGTTEWNDLASAYFGGKPKQNNLQELLKAKEIEFKKTHAHKTGLKRSLKGENSNRAILTNEKVLDMKNKYKSGSKIKDLHKEFKIKYTTCWHIIKGNGHSL